MKISSLILIACTPFALIACGGSEHSDLHDHGDGAHEHSDAESQTWTCSMHPDVLSPEFGQCPTCKMDLIPVNDK